MKATYTPDEFADFIRDDPKAAVGWLQDAIGTIENHDAQVAAKSLLLLVLVSQSVRLMLHHEAEDYDDLMRRLARLSILLDERLEEFLEDWAGEELA